MLRNIVKNALYIHASLLKPQNSNSEGDLVRELLEYHLIWNVSLTICLTVICENK